MVVAARGGAQQKLLQKLRATPIAFNNSPLVYLETEVVVALTVNTDSPSGEGAFGARRPEALFSAAKALSFRAASSAPPVPLHPSLHINDHGKPILYVLKSLARNSRVKGMVTPSPGR